MRVTETMAEITTVIATRNGGARLQRLIPWHTGPVIVVDNASDDGSPERIERAFPRVRVIRLPRNIGAAARNVGVALAATPYVAFADDDSYWVSDSLDRAAAILRRHPNAGLLTGTVLVGPERRTDPVSTGMASAPLGIPTDQPGPAVLGFLACAAVVRCAAFRQVGGFNPLLHIYGEEDLFALDLAAAGWSLSYVPSLVVHHLPSPVGRDPRGRRVRQTRNRLLTAVLRRPPRVVWAAMAAAARDPRDRPALLAAVPGLRWAVRNRRLLPAAVERARALLDADPADQAGHAAAAARRR
jgi:GT2 family glycosyltransferase